MDKNFTKADISKAYSYRCARGLILLDAYLHPKQDNLLPHNFEIEHIFPESGKIQTITDGREKMPMNF